MTNEEAIKSMRNLDDVISITESEHESVKTAISALEHNSLLIEHISNLQNENIVFFNKLVETENENTKLKAEIERLKNQNNHYFEQYSASIDEIEQLKSELEQSVKLPYLAGTPLYFAFSKQGIVKDKIRRWQINEHGIVFYSKGSAYPVEFIGKYAFLTREEAEQSLKGQV